MRPILALLAMACVGAAAPGRLDVELHGLRNARGDIRLCLSRSPDRFPDCAGDPTARSLTVKAGGAVSFDGLPAGDYALALFHDENRNGRLDTFAKIPREGFGFSRNPGVRFGAPSYAEARFRISGGDSVQRVQMRYLL